MGFRLFRMSTNRDRVKFMCPFYGEYFTLAETYISAEKPGHPGKSRQIAAMDGSQLVVENREVYYRARFSGHRRSEAAFESLPYRRRFFHSFKKARRAELIPGSVSYKPPGITIKFRLSFLYCQFYLVFFNSNNA